MEFDFMVFQVSLKAYTACPKKGSTAGKGQKKGGLTGPPV
jgi:hypothetical protein